MCGLGGHDANTDLTPSALAASFRSEVANPPRGLLRLHNKTPLNKIRELS
jgi:hypothetical protein